MDLPKILFKLSLRHF